MPILHLQRTKNPFSIFKGWALNNSFSKDSKWGEGVTTPTTPRCGKLIIKIFLERIIRKYGKLITKISFERKIRRSL